VSLATSTETGRVLDSIREGLLQDLNCETLARNFICGNAKIPILPPKVFCYQQQIAGML